MTQERRHQDTCLCRGFETEEFKDGLDRTQAHAGSLVLFPRRITHGIVLQNGEDEEQHGTVEWPSTLDLREQPDYGTQDSSGMG
jgi:hypothetical protein